MLTGFRAALLGLVASFGLAGPALADGQDVAPAADGIGHADQVGHPSRARHHVWGRRDVGPAYGYRVARTRHVAPAYAAPAQADEWTAPEGTGWVEMIPSTVARGLAYNSPALSDHPELRPSRYYRYGYARYHGHGGPVISARY